MKKIVVLFLLLVFLTGCGEKKLLFENWPSTYPKYTGKGNIVEKQNKKIIIVQNVSKEDVKTYMSKVKEEYSSSIAENDTIYQGMNKNNKMIVVKYNEKKGTLTISNS